MKLFCKFFCTSLQYLINTGRILAACLSHIRTATAAAADKLSHCFDQIAGMCALLHGTVCCHSKKAYFAAVFRCQKNNTVTKFSLQLIAQIHQFLHINIFDMYRQEGNTIHILHLIHDIAHGILRHLILQLIILRC